MKKPRYATIFLTRTCPRNCSYCAARLVPIKKYLTPDEWIRVFKYLEEEGVEFFLILGNEVLIYPWIVELVRRLREEGFWGKYAMYSTFPEPWYSKLREKLVEAGLYSISSGVDVIWKDEDKSITEKSLSGLEGLVWFKEHGVPDVQATVTIHARNWRRLHEIYDVITEKGIWIGTSIVEYNVDGRYDFFPGKKVMEGFILEGVDRAEFKRYMYYIASEVRRGRWMMQLPPEYFEFLGEVGGVQTSWHCTMPSIITIDADGTLRLCAYRPFSKYRGNALDFGSAITLDDYAKWRQEEAPSCPGCIWGYQWMSEFFYVRGEAEFGDLVIQAHKSKYWRQVRA